jgi:two-component system nitrate/nitrite response regulator NarL
VGFTPSPEGVGSRDPGQVNVRLVVIEDDPRFRQLATVLLTSRGLDVVATASDGRTGIETVLSHAPDGVLLDLGLPDLDGLAVAAALRSAAPAVVVVLTSAERIAWSREELAEAGIRAFVAKEALLDVDLAALFGP